MNEVFDFSDALTNQQKQTELYSISSVLYDHIYAKLYASGLSKSEFYKQFFASALNPNTLRFRVKVFYSKFTMHPVGFITFTLKNMNFESDDKIIARSLALILPSHRGSSLTNRFLGMEFLYAVLLSWVQYKQVVFFYKALSPASYYAIARYAFSLYPHYKTPENSSIVTDIATALELPPERNSRLLTRSTGLYQENHEDYLKWLKHSHPAVKFYLKENPEYQKGTCLMVVVPLTLTNLIVSSMNWLLDGTLKYFNIRRSSYKTSNIA